MGNLMALRQDFLHNLLMLLNHHRRNKPGGLKLKFLQHFQDPCRPLFRAVGSDGRPLQKALPSRQLSRLIPPDGFPIQIKPQVKRAFRPFRPSHPFLHRSFASLHPASDFPSLYQAFLLGCPLSLKLYQHPLPPVRRHDLAGHVVRRLRHKEQNCIGDILRDGYPP